MSRLSRAWRELRRPDPAEYEPDGLRLDLYGYRAMHELREPLREIATALTRIERRKRRPRIVQCEHPELHPDVNIGVVD